MTKNEKESLDRVRATFAANFYNDFHSNTYDISDVAQLLGVIDSYEKTLNAVIENLQAIVELDPDLSVAAVNFINSTISFINEEIK